MRCRTGRSPPCGELVDTDGRVGGDDPARHRGAAPAEAAAAGARRRRGAAPAAVRRHCRPAFRGQRGGQRRQEAGDRARPPSRFARTANRSSSTAARPPSRWCIILAAARLQVLTNSFPIAEHLIKHSRNTVMVPGGVDLPRAGHHPQPVRERRDAQFLRAAHVHGRAGRRPARRDGARSAADPGRAEADRPGGGTGPAGRFVEIRAALQPDPLPARAGRHVITDDGVSATTTPR